MSAENWHQNAHDAPIRVEPYGPDVTLWTWTAANGRADGALEVGWKMMRGVLDDDGRQTHVLGIVGHET